MITQLPEWFWADRLTPIRFYGYPSYVREKLLEFDIQEAAEEEVNRFNDIKRKCMETPLKQVTTGVTDIDVWDNRVVIECRTERGNTVYIGYCDNLLSLGLSIETQRKPRPYTRLVSA